MREVVMPKDKLFYFHRKHGYVQVKRGFSWPAFLFGSFWALAKRMYLLFFVMFVVEAALWFVTGYANGQGLIGLSLFGAIGTLAYAVVRGKYANRWLESYLAGRGYAVEGQGGST
jgi:hypothetical protein